MVTIREKATRPHGLTAVATPGGDGSVSAQSGAGAALAVTNADAGFTPVELLDAALAGCLAVSIRYAAKRQGLLERVGAVEVLVDHEKAPDDLSRVARFVVRYRFEGAVSDEERKALIAEGHRLCTVGNTLAAGAEIVDAED